MFDIYWQGLLLPLAYLGVLVGTFVTFSRVYRRRKAGMFLSASCPPLLANPSARPLTVSLPSHSRKRKPRAMVRSAPATQHLPVAAAHGARGGVREGAQDTG